MEGPVKRKVISRTDPRPPSRSDSNTPTPFSGSNVTVRAKLSQSSISKAATSQNRSPPSLTSITRSRSPTRIPVSRPVSVLGAPSIFPDTPNSHTTSHAFVPKAKKSSIALNKNAGASNSSVAGTRPSPKPVLAGRDWGSSITPFSHSGPSPSVPARAVGRSLTPTGSPNDGRRRAGSISDDGRSSNLSSNMSSNVSLSSGLSSPSTSSPVNAFASFGETGKIMSRNHSGSLGIVSGQQQAGNGPPNGAPIRIRAKLSGVVVPVVSSPTSSAVSSRPVDTPQIGAPRDVRSNSISSTNPPRPASQLTLHRRVPSGTPRLTAAQSRSSPPTSNNRMSPPNSPVTASPPRPRARTVVSFNNLHHLNDSSMALLSNGFGNGALRSPVTSSLSLSSRSSVSIPYSPGERSANEPTGRLSEIGANGIAKPGSSRAEYFVASVTPDERGIIDVEDEDYVRSAGVVSPPAGDAENLEGSSDEALDDSDTKDAEHEAKSNRKIADLEISNRSLLAINTMLEADKLRLSREIRDLRRRLRESRLSLPPQAFKALKQRQASTSTDTGSPGASGSHPPSDDDEEDEEDEEDQVPDPEYERVTALIDTLIFRAHEAIKNTPVSSGPTPTKVLSPAEVELHYENVRHRISGAGGHEAPAPSSVATDEESNVTQKDVGDAEEEGDEGQTEVGSVMANARVEDNDIDEDEAEVQVEEGNNDVEEAVTVDRTAESGIPSFTLNVTNIDTILDEGG